MPRILIADDDQTVREMLAMILASRGHETREAEDALLALEAFDDFQPDLLIVDLAMPNGGGLHVVRELRARTPRIDCPIVILSGYADAVDATELAGLDTPTVLEKPLTIDALFHAVDGVLGAPPVKQAAKPLVEQLAT